jgi:sugar lactone lactonase YvrE
MRTLVDGRGLVESPRWHDGRLWFADWILGEIVAVDSAGRAAEVMVRHESLPLSFDFRNDGTPLIVSGPLQALVRPSPDGSLDTYADLSGLSPYGCNEIVVDGRGNAYVNNPGYNPMAGPPPDGERAPGVVALVTPDGSATIVADDLAFPNGMAVTADNATLVIAESHRGRLTAFDIGASGDLSGRRVWADLDGGAPDGICCDADAAIWYADIPNRRCVRVREGGEVLQTIDLDQGAYACMLGGADRPTLFITAADWPGMSAVSTTAAWNGRLIAVPVPTPGAGWPASGPPR